MKAKEAPEKLYLLPNGLISYCKNTDEDVEYTSTDAFVEKAVEWLRNEIYTFDPRDTEKMIENFKKAMML